MSLFTVHIGVRPDTAVSVRRFGLATDDFFAASELPGKGIEAQIKRFVVALHEQLSGAPSAGGVMIRVCEIACSSLAAESARVVEVADRPITRAKHPAGSAAGSEDFATYARLFEQRGAMVSRSATGEWIFGVSHERRLLLVVRGVAAAENRDLLAALGLIAGVLVDMAHALEASRSRAPGEIVRRAVLLGTSAHAQRLRGIYESERDRNTPLWITGKAGSGREDFARALHEGSSRSSYAFVALTPDALQLRDSFEAIAGSGTCCILGFERCDPTQRARVMELLAKAPATRVVIVSTGSPASGWSNEWPVVMVPTLGERADDVPVMAQFYAGEAVLTDDALVALASREASNFAALQTLIERARANAKDGRIQAPDVLGALSLENFDIAKAMETFERQWVVRALEAHGQHRINTAKALGMSRQSLARKMKEWRMIDDDTE
jgi:hypothetical protein